MPEHTLADIATQLGVALGGAFLFSITHFAKNRERDGEAFDESRFYATMLVGLALGVIGVALGIPVDQEYIWTSLGMYAGVVAVVEAAGKALYSRAKRLTD